MGFTYEPYFGRERAMFANVCGKSHWSNVRLVLLYRKFMEDNAAGTSAEES
jgi:hypothetical protein|eukprot:SAG25_NODE_393_length_8567_cov_15.363368_2_plen_51_part_00